MHDDLKPSPQRVRVMQIIAGALIAGLIAFAGVAVFLVHSRPAANQAPPPDLPLFSLVALAMLVMETPLAILLPYMQTQAALRRLAARTWSPPPGMSAEQFPTLADKLLAVRQTGLIIRLALFQGFGFMGCIAYLLEAHPLALAVVGFAMLAEIVNFPTEGGLRVWLERQQNAMNEMRQ